ncbi:hypothetical protein [Cyanobium sp. ATX 6F1]|uniref:hypothetical protein n=1 Tax=unclassified Cyanobium TaxID=2627006 RepID=UPI0020CD2B95|nr:hypothetical protein [Cyanobium sp. ATX 6F1]MCP9917747.1 hypothetical protein [Cyanobium sp. ATX 6F1]
MNTKNSLLQRLLTIARPSPGERARAGVVCLIGAAFAFISAFFSYALLWPALLAICALSIAGALLLLSVE